MASDDDLFAGLIVNGVKQPPLKRELNTGVSQSPVSAPEDNYDNLFEGLIIDGKPFRSASQTNDLPGFGQTEQQRDQLNREMNHPSEPISRNTRAVKELAELGSGGLLAGEDAGKTAAIIPALLTTTDPRKIGKILNSSFPHIGITQDEGQNWIANNNKTGVQVVINKPDISKLDVLQGLGLVTAFTPAAKASALATSTFGKALAVGGASATTQAGIDLAGQAAGTEDEVKIGNIDPVNVGIAGIAGGAFELAFRALSPFLSILRRTVSRDGVTGEVREAFRNMAKENGINPSEISDGVIVSFLKSSGKSAKPNPNAAIQGEKEFGINLTKGQRSQNQKQLSFEDSARAGSFGGKPQEILLSKEAQTNKEILTAKNTVQESIAGEKSVIYSQQESGALLRQGTLEAEATADAAVKESFDSVGDATLNGPSFVNLVKSVRASVRSPEFLKSETLAPASNSLLNKVNKYLKTVGSQAKEIKPQHIKQIELMRRVIGTHMKAAANLADSRTLITMKNSFDDFLDEAVKKALFKGDQKALSVLKESRSLFSRYAAKFRVNPIRTKSGRTIADKEGDFIEKIIAGNPTDEQVINSVFGASNSFGNLAGVRMARRFKNILGPDSTEWTSVKQAAFMRLMRYSPDQKTISGSKTLTAIRESITKNKSLMTELFSSQELSLINRLATQIKRAQPDLVRSRENPSGTSQALIKSITAMISRLGQTMGFATGNPLLIIGSKGIEIGSGFRAASRSRKAVKPFKDVFDLRPQPVAAGTAGSVIDKN